MKRKRGARLSPTYHQDKPATDSFSGNSKLDRKEIGESHDNISVRYSLSHNHTKCSSVDMRNPCVHLLYVIFTQTIFTHTSLPVTKNGKNDVLTIAYYLPSAKGSIRAGEKNKLDHCRLWYSSCREAIIRSFWRSRRTSDT